MALFLRKRFIYLFFRIVHACLAASFLLSSPHNAEWSCQRDKNWRIALIRLFCVMYVKICPDWWLFRKAHPTEGNGGEIQAAKKGNWTNMQTRRQHLCNFCLSSFPVFPLWSRMMWKPVNQINLFLQNLFVIRFISQTQKNKLE